MREVFGVPVDTLLVILAVALVVALGVLAILALRNRILLKLAVRNAGRRRGRTALIVVGLMLGTAIIAAALVTGDTMNNTIRATAVDALGNTDETVAPKGAVDDIPGALGAATGMGWLPESTVEHVERALDASGLADGVTGAIVDQVALQAPGTRQSEPSVVLFAADPTRMDGFSPIVGSDGTRLSLADLRPGELYLNTKAAKKLRVAAGDKVVVYAGSARPQPRVVREVVRFDGAITSDASMLVPLAAAQQLFGHPGEIRGVLVSNRGGATSGAALTDDVVAQLDPLAKRLDLEVTSVKQDAIDMADEMGASFTAFFTTFGMFSIAAGILLIFLIFVMLAAERRGELGIARAIGTRRGHLVEMFTFEGAAYDLLAAAVGALLGAVFAFGMVLIMAQAFGAGDADEGLQIEFAVSWHSLVVAFAMGLLLTLLVVAVSAWRVSVMTIAAAIRGLPEPAQPRRRRRLVLALVGLALGSLLVFAGMSGDQATPLDLGVALVLMSLVPLLRLAGVSERVAFTACGLAVVVFLMLPWRWQEAVFGQLGGDFSTWIVAGLLIVIGTVWVIVFNADLLLGGVMRIFGRIRSLAPVLRMSMAYPLRARFRTGTTLAMFTLVVFTLVTGSAANGSFVHAIGVDDFGGGFQVRAGTVGAAPIEDMATALRTAGIRASEIPFVGSQSVLAVEAKQLGTGRGYETYLVRGLDPSFLEHTTFGFGQTARGYDSAQEVWNALRTKPGLAVVDSTVVPRRDNFNFGAAPDFVLSGFLYEEGALDPIPIEVLDKQTGRTEKLTVIGILKDTAPVEMLGITTSQQTLSTAFPGRTQPTIHYFGLAQGVDPEDTAAALESAFLENGLDAQSIQEVVDDTVAANMTFNRLIQGFLGLGLLVGVAALGVISARAVVERRQQIGVMRAIGFRREMVQAAFLLESSFVALTAIVVGTALGLLLAWNIIDDTRQQPSWAGMSLYVPWLNLFVIFLAVYAIALLATLLPAIRASRIRPAEALRYQ